MYLFVAVLSAISVLQLFHFKSSQTPVSYSPLKIPPLPTRNLYRLTSKDMYFLSCLIHFSFSHSVQ